MSTTHIQRKSLDDIILRHTNARRGHVFVDVRTIKKIAIEFADTNQNRKVNEKELFNLGYRTGYSQRSEEEYNDAISANWQEAFEVENEIPTNIEIIEPSDDVNLLTHNQPYSSRHT